MISKRDLYHIMTMIDSEGGLAVYYCYKMAERSNNHKANTGKALSLDEPAQKELYNKMCYHSGRMSVYAELLEEYERQHDQTRSKK